ncbi:MAG: hypothetical protein WED06_01825 [Candidatus Paceibacterota bacterium]
MKSELEQYIKDSSLSEEDKGLWSSILEQLDDDQAKVFIDFINGKEENLQLLTHNIKAKKEALEKGDDKLLEKILKQEEND